MSKLPPLRVPKKPVGLASSTGTVALGELPEGVSGKVEIGSLARQTAELLQVSYPLRVPEKIVVHASSALIVHVSQVSFRRTWPNKKLNSQR